MDPDSYMAQLYDRVSYNVTHTTAPYVPAKFATTDVCKLWDSKCSGNFTDAANRFFNCMTTDSKMRSY